MDVNLSCQRYARDMEDIPRGEYLSGISPDLVVAMREYARRSEQRTTTATKDRTPPSAEKPIGGGLK
jgi:hypothetical protein